MIRKGPTLTFVQPVIRKGSALTFDTCEEPIQHACFKGRALTSDQVGTNPTVISECPSVPDQVFLVIDQEPPFQEWHLALTSDHVGTNPTVTSEWLSNHI